MAFNRDLNPYVDVIRQGLADENCPVDSGTEKFWNGTQFDYDLVHIQWPETLFDWKVPTPVEMIFLRQRLKEVKRRAKVVYTRHNETSNHATAENGALLRELYDLMETECDAMIHLGEFSRSACLQKPALCHKPHVVIPIPAYEKLYAPFIAIPAIAARKQLGLPGNRKIILAFGNFRHPKEHKLVSDAFLSLKNRHSCLVAPKWHKSRNYAFDPRRPVLFLRSLRKALWSKMNRMVLNARKTVTDEDVARYFSAADVVFVQRVNGLNSGNIPMAFLFRKTVVGPNIGNIGELLVATGNPVFNPEDPTSVHNALKQGLALSSARQGEMNFEYAMTHFTTARIAAAHTGLYRELAPK